MNSVKLQDITLTYKNLNNFYTLTMSFMRNKEIDPIYNSIKNNKILRNKFNQGGERYLLGKLQDIEGKKKIKEDTNKWKDILCS